MGKVIVETYYSKDNQKIGGVLVTGFIVRNYKGKKRIFQTMENSFDVNNYYNIPCDKNKYMFAGGYHKVKINGEVDYKEEDVSEFLMCGKFEVMETKLDGIAFQFYNEDFDKDKHIEVKIVIRAENNSWSWSDTYRQN